MSTFISWLQISSFSEFHCIFCFFGQYAVEFGRKRWELDHVTRSTLSQVHSTHSPVVHHVLIPLFIDPQAFWKNYSKATNLLLNWTKSWIIWTTNIKKNQDNRSLGQPVIYTLPTVRQDKWGAGMQVHRVERGVSACVHENNETASASIHLSCVFSLWAQSLDCVKRSGAHSLRLFVVIQ